MTTEKPKESKIKTITFIIQITKVIIPAFIALFFIIQAILSYKHMGPAFFISLEVGKLIFGLLAMAIAIMRVFYIFNPDTAIKIKLNIVQVFGIIFSTIWFGGLIFMTTMFIKQFGEFLIDEKIIGFLVLSVFYFLGGIVLKYTVFNKSINSKNQTESQH